MHLFADYFDLIWVIVCFHIVTIKIFQAFWAAFYVLLVQLLHFRLLIGVKSNHFRAIQRGDLLPSIRLDFVWLYNGTEKALLIGSAIRVWYTIVFHCIDIERVRTMGSDGVQCGAVGYMIVVAAWRFSFPYGNRAQLWWGMLFVITKGGIWFGVLCIPLVFVITFLKPTDFTRFSLIEWRTIS